MKSYKLYNYKVTKLELQLISVSHPLQDGSVANVVVPFIMLIMSIRLMLTDLTADKT